MAGKHLENLSRQSWIDVAKGIAIFFVVFGHAVRGVRARGYIEYDLYYAIDQRVYLFHMPLFFALAGFFLLRQIGAARSIDFVKSRLTRLIWPLVLWTYIFLTARYFAGDFASQPMNLNEIFIMPIPGILQFWFLWALFIVSIALIISKPSINNGVVSPIVSLLLIALAFGHILNWVATNPLSCWKARRTEDGPHGVRFA